RHAAPRRGGRRPRGRPRRGPHPEHPRPLRARDHRRTPRGPRLPRRAAHRRRRARDPRGPRPPRCGRRRPPRRARRPGRRGSGPRDRRARRRGPRRTARLPDGRAPRPAPRHDRWDRLRRRHQGHQPRCGRRLPARRRTGRVDRGRRREGCGPRSPDRRLPRPAGRRGAARHGPDSLHRGPRPTRARGPAAAHRSGRHWRRRRAHPDDGGRGARRPLPRLRGGRGAAGPGRRLHRPVPCLCGAGGSVRGGRHPTARRARMTLEETRRGPREDARRTAPVVRPDEDQPLGNIGGRLRDGVAGWLRSPALDFYGLIVVGALLVTLGLVMVLSSSAVLNISRGNSGFAGLFRQGTFAGMGLALLVVAALLPPGFYRKAAWPLFGLGLALQCLVFVPGLGWAVDGNQNWIRINGQTLQPSEFLKLALAVWLGALLAAKRPLLHRTFHLLFPLVPGVVLALGLVMAGHDLGTMLIMAMLVAGAVWVAGIPRRWFFAAGTAGVLGVVLLTITSANRMARISNWLHGICEGDSCYQSDQGLMGLAEGGWWGVGLGESRQKWGRLPAAED